MLNKKCLLEEGESKLFFDKAKLPESFMQRQVLALLLLRLERKEQTNPAFFVDVFNTVIYNKLIASKEMVALLKCDKSTVARWKNIKSVPPENTRVGVLLKIKNRLQEISEIVNKADANVGLNSRQEENTVMCM